VTGCFNPLTIFVSDDLLRFVSCALFDPERDGRCCVMTILERAFAEAAKLPKIKQDVLASRILAELEAQNDFDLAIARSSDKLAALAAEALAQYRSGLTEVLDPDQLSSAECLFNISRYFLQR
jgi:hypothetical protein